MRTVEVKELLLWCGAFNYTTLLLWFFALIVARDWVYHLHSRFFKLEPRKFDAAHSGGMGICKRDPVFNAAPWLALQVVS